MAELMLSDIAKRGDQRSAVHINWALAVLYQFRWWEGACQLYNTVGSAPDSDRQRLAGTLAKGLEAQASLWEKRGLTGDAADLRKLAASFLPWPEGPVVFAARWLPELTAANRDPAMMRFAEWCRLGEFTDPLRQDDLARLFGAAIDSPAAYLPPMLVEGLMRNIATLPESPLVWTEAVIKSMKNTAQIRPFLGIPLHEQITNHAGIMMHAKLSGFIANALLSGDSHYEPSALAAWQAFGEKVMPDREPVAWDAHIAARRYDTYDIEGGDLAWSTLSANQDAIRSTRDSPTSAAWPSWYPDGMQGWQPSN